MWHKFETREYRFFERIKNTLEMAKSRGLGVLLPIKFTRIISHMCEQLQLNEIIQGT